MKSKEERNKLKEEVESVNGKLSKLTDEDLKQVTGGIVELPGTRNAETKIHGVEDEGAIPPCR